MISLDPKKYMGKYYLVIRTWDGIDQPDYFPVFQIDEDEMSLDTKRFSRYAKFVDPSADLYELFLAIQEPKKELGLFISWILDNTVGLWRVNVEGGCVTPFWRISFTNSEDAVLFKLVWSAASSKYDLIRS
jgi:hypothetical protein